MIVRLHYWRLCHCPCNRGMCTPLHHLNSLHTTNLNMDFLAQVPSLIGNSGQWPHSHFQNLSLLRRRAQSRPLDNMMAIHWLEDFLLQHFDVNYQHFGVYFYKCSYKIHSHCIGRNSSSHLEMFVCFFLVKIKIY